MNLFSQPEPQNYRYLAAVSGWSQSNNVLGPSGMGAIITRLDEDGSSQEVEWSIHACSNTSYRIQKEAETFFWNTLRISRSSVVNRRGKQVWRTPLTWITDGDSVSFVRAQRLARAAATEVSYVQSSLKVDDFECGSDYQIAIAVAPSSLKGVGFAIGLCRNGRRATWSAHRCSGDVDNVCVEAHEIGRLLAKPDVPIDRVFCGELFDHVMERAVLAANRPLIAAGIETVRRVT